MDFFARQESARKHTLRLVLLFLAAVVGVVAAVDLAVALAALLSSENPFEWGLFPFQILDAVILVAIIFFALRRLFQLRGGGEAIAKMVKARQVMRNANSLEEKRLLNVVEEMAIAAGVTVPSVWVLDNEDGINAFAAGYSPNQAVIVVTRGALTALNREELQGVIGHEYGHILNGDMRLNVQLIGILAGIVVVGEAGLLIIRLGASADDAAYAIIPFGALIAAIGYIGVFFGRMIKAAVSRQREFLADASSVQFTRNPDGLAGALEKIRRADGATVNNAFAGEMSHMFFSQAFSARLFEDLFATHPSIDERIEGITGRKPQGARSTSAGVSTASSSWLTDEAAVSGLGGGPAQSLLNQVGSATPQHVEQAARQLAAMPESLRRLLNTPQGARAVVYAYLMSSSTAVLALQLGAVSQAGDTAITASLEQLAATLQQLGPPGRLTVLSLALPTLRQMDQSARDVFLQAVDKLVLADQEVTLSEFVMQTILQRQLSAKAGRAERVRFKTLAPVRADALLLLAALAHAGGGDAKTQQFAFERGLARLELTGDLVTDKAPDARTLGAALERLRRLAPLQKPLLVKACVDTALADNYLLVAEAELLRAIGMAIDCPMPPVLDTQAVV